ncbi:MAG: hypothetical protein ACREML_09060 [Vulcanimicrobiaceae bacterium]
MPGLQATGNGETANVPDSRPFPREVECFISSCIDSVEQVEILLLLSSEPERRWTLDEIRQQLRSSRRSVALRLSSLIDHELVARDDCNFHYAASSADDALVKRLAAIYGERRTAVINRIFTEPRDAMRTFADAFLLKDSDDDR